ncbi:MAG TPA: hypothetical protein VFC41_00765, partial [Anaerovoracaceae bacterium]|nr:hypothetical protein [Anaerovoracaceae bacterium]
GKYVAFSEGNTMSSFIYEWVVLPNGDTWKIMNAGESIYTNIEPIIFTKVANALSCGLQHHICSKHDYLS